MFKKKNPTVSAGGKRLPAAGETGFAIKKQENGS